MEVKIQNNGAESPGYSPAAVTSVESIENVAPPNKKPKYGFGTFKSPKKRLEMSAFGQDANNKTFKYGNYNRYYGYRNMSHDKDARLKVFHTKKEIFAEKEVLDIGCNIGSLTLAVAQDLNVRRIFGIDIDKTLINQAKKSVLRARKCHKEKNGLEFPFNVIFEHGNYVVRDPILLEIEEIHQFDLILCLSVTKWIHLNFGDEGLKLAFKRMYKQLKPDGRLILEAQPWSSYKRRKKLTVEIEDNYQKIKLRPADFSDYLLSNEVGFTEMYELAKTSSSKGFQRPLQVFVKSQVNDG